MSILAPPRSAYVLVTPAHNEALFIEHTISSILSQTIKPLRWVIVNDGSSDNTGAIIEQAIRGHDFIRLIDIDRSGGRDFGRKAVAFRHGLDSLNGLDYDFIGNLDADISVQPHYYEAVLRSFSSDLSLGIVGGAVHHSVGEKYYTTDTTLDSVGGAVQLFRRACFEEVGGYQPLPLGGIDAAAEIHAKMLGWKVAKIPELIALEHRETGCALIGPVAAHVRLGRRFYSLGYSPLFYFLRCLYRIKDRPYFVGSIAALYGYVASRIMNQPIMLSQEIVHYLRQEQRRKIRESLGGLF